MRIPFVPEIPDVVEMLKLLSNATAYAQRLTDLKNLQDDLNKQINTYEKYQDIDNALAQAKANLVNAEGIRRKADDYVAVRKAEADEAYATQMEQIQRARNESSAMAKELDARATALEAEARALDNRQNLLEQQKQKLESLQAEMIASKKSADEMRSIYAEKLRQIKAVAGE